MVWSFKRRETREASGGYTEIISRLIESQAAGTTQQASATAAVEAAAGALSRAFAAAEVVAPPDVQEALSPRCLALLGRDLIRVGESLHVIRMMGGALRLVPCSTWYFEGDADPSTWTVTATAYGPSGSTTWRVPWSSVIFAEWGSPTARPYHGLGPMAWAAETARLGANAERSLADEASGPVAGLLPVPEGNDAGSDDDDDDPLASLRSDIGKARGKALLLETTSSGYGDGRGNAPARDWDPRYLHPAPTESMVKLSDAAFARVLAACGCSPALFDDSDGTSKREAQRQFFLNTVAPLARVVERELSDKFGVPVSLRFDLHNFDLAGRAAAFQKLVAGGVAVPEALATSGLLADDG